MLRSTRGLLLVAIILMVAAVAATYYRQKSTQAQETPRAPRSLPTNTDAVSTDWVWRKDQATHGIVEIRAKKQVHVSDPSVLQIEGVELLVYKKEGQEYDDIRSEKAVLDEAKGTLYADGAVEITMGVPAGNAPHGQLMQIHTSGVTYTMKSGLATTDRPAEFQFQAGDGKSVGASYDPNTHEIAMKSQVVLNWKGRDAKTKPMKIETGQLLYKEKDSTVHLWPWSRLTRETGVLEGGDAIVTLKDGVIHQVDAKNARGDDHQPGRTLEYAADQFQMNMDADGQVQHIGGEPNAHLISTSEAARTTVNCRRVDLDFDTAAGTSDLKQALATGNAVVESVPLPRPGVQLPETRIIRSDKVLLKMRPGGKELANVETEGPGHLEFLPNRPGQRHRTLDGDRIYVAYGAANVIESFRATNASTRTDPEPVAGKKKGDPMFTSSKELKADFDPKTGQLARMEQWNEFRYQEGERRARANRATLEQAKNLITLEQGARIWDASGATAADRILLDQKSGDISAEGNVASTRMPDRKGDSSAMLANDEPLEAKAAKMQTTNRNQKIHYEGHASVWQGANRIWADVVDIDRDDGKLWAKGSVRTQFVDRQKDDSDDAQADGAAKPKAAAAQAPAFVYVTSSQLVYSDDDRLAHYTGGVHLTRPGMDVKSQEIRAFLNDSDSDADSSLNHAFADGQVSIIRAQPGRTLTGTGEHSEYYSDDDRIFLSGGTPVLVDSTRGVTKGKELTYYVNNDKLLVNGMDKQPVSSRVLRRRKH